MRFFKSVEFVLLVAALMGISAFGIDAVLPAFPVFAQEFALDGERSNQVQWVVYVFMLGFSLTPIVFGTLADFLGRKKLLLLGLGIYVLASLAVLWVETFQGLLVARFWQGVGLSAPRVLSQAVVRDVVSGREMSRLMSFSMAVFLLVPIIAPFIGQITLVLANWRAIFILFVVLGVGIFIWIVCRLPETLPQARRKAVQLSVLQSALSTCFRHRPTALYMLILGALFAMMMTYIGQAEQIYGGAVYGLGDKFALAFAVSALGMAAASFLNSRLVMRLGMHRIVFWALALMLCSDFGLLVAALFCAGKPPLWLFMPLLMLHLFCFSMSMPNLNSLILEPHGKISGTISAVSGTLMSILGLSIAQFVASHFNGTVFALVIGWFVLSAFANIANFYVNRLTYHNK